MTNIVTRDTLDDFERLSSYDIETFFNNYIEFSEFHYANITNFFSGVSSIVPTESINKLSWLVKEYKKIVDVTILNAVSLSNLQYWDLLEYIEDIGHALETADNSSKWLRSALTSTGYKQQVVVDYMLSQGETLEQAERKALKSTNFRDTWVETALENNLEEEDYDGDGGALIKVIYKNNSSLILEGVVDNIDTPEKTYGKDIDRNITFEDDDLKVLSYQDTLTQCVDILTNLKREDDPAFPDRGINTKAIIGGNLAAISYPSIFRDLAGNFATDDSFKAISITDVKKNQDIIYLDFQIETKAGDVFSRQVQL